MNNKSKDQLIENILAMVQKSSAGPYGSMKRTASQVEVGAVDPKQQRVLTELEAVDVNNVTPLQALNLVATWKGWLR